MGEFRFSFSRYLGFNLTEGQTEGLYLSELLIPVIMLNFSLLLFISLGYPLLQTPEDGVRRKVNLLKSWSFQISTSGILWSMQLCTRIKSYFQWRNWKILFFCMMNYTISCTVLLCLRWSGPMCVVLTTAMSFRYNLQQFSNFSPSTFTYWSVCTSAWTRNKLVWCVYLVPHG